MVDDSPVMLDLLYVLGSKPDELAAFVTLAQTKPLEAVRKLAVMENLVKSELGKTAKTDTSTTQRGEDGKFQSTAGTETPENKGTKAPPPAREVGGRGTLGKPR